MWTQQDAIAWCRRAEQIAPAIGFHVALTGGCLYKDGARKDLDVVLYRIRWQELAADAGYALVEALQQAGLIDLASAEEGVGCLGVESQSGDCDDFVVKARHQGRPVDLIFPENTGEYDDSHRSQKEEA